MKKLIFLLVSVVAFSSCSKDEDITPVNPELNETEVATKYDETFQFSVAGSSTATWSLSTDSIGEIDADGLFTAKRIGEADVIATVGDIELKGKIVVEPYITNFKLPLLKKSTKDQIKVFENKEVEFELAHLLLYNSINPQIREYSYVFTQEQSSLVNFQLADYEEALEYAQTFLKERFPETEQSTEDALQFHDQNNNCMIDISRSGRYPEVRFHLEWWND